MERKIIKIDEDKCIGCGACATACHEGAIAMIDGKARLIRDDYCDGLGDCLPSCPTDAISFEIREAAAYNEAAVLAAKTATNNTHPAQPLPCGCPGTHSKMLKRNVTDENNQDSINTSSCCDSGNTSKSNGLTIESELMQWPVQIKLVPINAPYFDGANLLIAADCTAYAYGNFHKDFMKNKITLIGCPKLDEGDYAQKLTAIIKENNIKSVTVIRMEVPCCGGIENAVKTALQGSGKFIPWQVFTIGTSGEILNR